LSRKVDECKPLVVGSRHVQPFWDYSQEMAQGMSQPSVMFKVGRCRVTLSNPLRKRLDPGTKRLKMKYSNFHPLSSFAFNFESRRYMKGQLNDGRTIMVKDYLEAYWWVRDNTPQDARIMVGRCGRHTSHVAAVSE